MLRLTAVVWPAPVVAGLLLIGGRGPLLAVVVLALFWPASLALLIVFGPRAAVAAAIACSALLVSQFLLPAPTMQAQRISLERRFTSLDQVARHQIKLPSDAAARWGLTTRRPPPQPYLYLSIVNRALGDDPPLRVTVGAYDLGRATRATRVAAQYRGADSEVFWHRLALPLAVLSGEATLEVQIVPDPTSGFVPGVVGLMGGYSYRPTSPPTPSSFFDNGSWQHDPVVVLPGEGHPPGFHGPVRYHVELRVLDPATRQFIDVLY
jgi:hypothetical protein